MTVREKLAALREKMTAYKMDMYLIGSEDFHGSEYVGEHFKCRAFISGFTGSAGTILVTQDFAGLWTDGRYFLQAEAQLADTGIELFKMGNEGVPTIEDYIVSHIEKGQCLGFDGADVQQIANAEKKIPTAWINEAGNDVTEEMVRYLRPLIHGSVAVPEQDSMPHYLFLGEAL